MAQSKPTPDENLEPSVSCHVCGKEIPRSEAVQPEGLEYALHFCGGECVARWRAELEREQER